MNVLQMRNKRSQISTVGLAGAVLLAVAVTACSARLDSHGNIPDPTIVESIRIGKSNRAQVSEMLGTPSARSTFDEESWYYVGTHTSKFAFLEEEVLERKVLVWSGSISAGSCVRLNV